MFSIFVIYFVTVLVAVSANDNAIDAAVRSTHTMRTMPVVSQHQRDHQAPVVDINSNQLPLTVRFNTHSSNINVVQKHVGHPAKVHQAQHTDEPDELIHHVNKPIIQRVHEIVHPYRIITQEIRPAQEKIETVVARDNGNFRGSQRGGGRNGGFSGNVEQQQSFSQGRTSGGFGNNGNVDQSFGQGRAVGFNDNEIAFSEERNVAISAAEQTPYTSTTRVANAPEEVAEQVYVEERVRVLPGNDQQTYAQTRSATAGYAGNDPSYAESKRSSRRVKMPSALHSSKPSAANSANYNSLVQQYVQQRRKSYRRA